MTEGPVLARNERRLLRVSAMVQEHDSSAHVLARGHTINGTGKCDLAFPDWRKHRVTVGTYKTRHAVAFFATILERKTVDGGFEGAGRSDLKEIANVDEWYAGDYGCGDPFSTG